MRLDNSIEHVTSGLGSVIIMDVVEGNNSRGQLPLNYVGRGSKRGTSIANRKGKWRNVNTVGHTRSC